MKIKEKNFKIRIQSLEQTLDDFETAFLDAHHKKSKNKKGELVLGFETFSLLSKILTPQRLRLLKTIRERAPNSMAELAKILQRSQANVHKDVRFLTDLGIVSLRNSRGPKRAGKAALQPMFDWSGFQIAV
jgi:predicted transcriptional regulator